MRLHRLNDALVDIEFVQKAPADFYVRARNLVVYRFPDVMQERTRASDVWVRTELGREHARDVRHLYRVLQHVLPVARAEIEAPKERGKFRIEANDACF